MVYIQEFRTLKISRRRGGAHRLNAWKCFYIVAYGWCERKSDV